jgi:hypothetical protein
MGSNAVLDRPRRMRRTTAPEEAAVRRLAALMRAEAAELGDVSWVGVRLGIGDEDLRGWGARVLPELQALMNAAGGSEVEPWAVGRPEPCPLTSGEVAALRRVAHGMRAEAAELRPDSPLARRLDGWGVRLALECAEPGCSPQVL